MAEHSGFFNARMVDGVLDRKYNANDYSENLAVVIGTGVKRSNDDDCKVTASGMVATVGVGHAWIEGHYYYNDSPLSFAAVSAPVGGTRYDRVMLRLDNNASGRTVRAIYVEGQAANNPVKPAPVRENGIYDIVLADIFVGTNATNLVVTDTRDDESICGWLFGTTGNGAFFKTLDNNFNAWFANAKDTLSSVSLFKRYRWSETLSTQASVVQFNIPQYDPETCFIEVYVNGILDNRYTVNNNIITFAGTLVAGTVVTVNAYKSIDGTGIETVAGEITALQNAVAALDGVSKFTYKCTGLNDNISLSQIAQAFYSGAYVPAEVTTAANAFLTAIGGNTYLAGLSAEAQITIDVVGRLGVTTPFAGSGTSASRYRYFGLGVAGSGNKRVIFDFAKCEKITVACSANTENIIFYGTDLYIENANVYAYSNGTSCSITMLAGSANNGNMNFDNCRFSISSSGNAIIATNGNFTNCYCIVKSSAGDGICFDAKTASLVRLIGGTYYSYINSSGVSRAAVINVATSETDAVVIAHNINCPTVSETGYMQRHIAIANVGGVYINGVCSTMTTSGSAVTIAGQIWKSKR